MIERVARAIQERSTTAGRGSSGLRSQPLSWPVCMDLARAAIEALRDPTAAMRKAIRQSPHDEALADRAELGWYRGIDAALKENADE